MLAAVLIVTPAASGWAQAPSSGGATRVEGPSTLDARITRLERQLSSRTLFELVERLDALQSDVQALRGELEIQTHELAQMKERERELFIELDRLARRSEAEAPAIAAASESPPGAARAPQDEPRAAATEPSAPSGSAPAGPSAPSGATGAGAETLGEQRAYTAAFNLLKEGRYEQATESFRSYLAEYPSGRFADNAQYWLGEAYYVTRQFPLSLKEFQALVEKFPQSAKAPGAQLKIGFIHHELGDVAQAKTVLDDLVARYPRTTEARLAADRLSRIGG